MNLSIHNIEHWEIKCLDLLRKATLKHGIKASCTEVSNYGSIFTRDAIMAGIAGLLYQDDIIIEGLKSTIEMLYKTRGTEGQIASNYKMKDDEIDHISFGTLSPKFDSATWYLLGISLLNNHGELYDIDYVKDTISLLNALEYNDKDLIYVPQGGNWADEYPYEGYILYDQVLRSWALQNLAKQYGISQWDEKSKAINNKISENYFNSETGHFNCTFTPADTNTTFDFAAHMLLGMLDSSKEDQHFRSSLDWLNKTFLSKGTLPAAFHPIIHEDDSDWHKVSKFHMYNFKNKPYHFHNGGIWFIWLGWYAMCLKNHDRNDELNQLADIIFKILNSLDNFNFDEYLAGNTLTPSGTKELCFTATGILFLCKSIRSSSNPLNTLLKKHRS